MGLKKGLILIFCFVVVGVSSYDELEHAMTDEGIIALMNRSDVNAASTTTHPSRLISLLNEDLELTDLPSKTTEFVIKDDTTRFSCLPGCHKTHGYCQLPNECLCHSGWEGEFCDTCSVSPGCDYGTCIEPWQCNCNEGWAGLFCTEEIDYCSINKPCENGGTCHNVVQKSFTCDCPEGFTGQVCDILKNPCSNNPCQNGGTCTNTREGHYTCNCLTGFGPNCETSTVNCKDKPCKNGGDTEDREKTSSPVLPSSNTEVLTGSSYTEHLHTDSFIDTGSGDFDESTGSPVTDTTSHLFNLPMSCFHTSCNSSEARILEKTILRLPEGSNVSVTCKIENESGGIRMFWYRNNVSQLMAKSFSKRDNVLNLELPRAIPSDSGLYSCVLVQEHHCCRAEIRLKVYPRPNYHFHLLIVGIVAAACLLICVPICLWRNYSFRKYSKQFKSTKVKKEDLLLSEI